MSRNKAATLERVLQSSVQEFSQKGFHLARVSDIASAARCSTETIYDVYVSKEGLFKAAIAHVFETLFGDTNAVVEFGNQIQKIECPITQAATVLTNFGSAHMDESYQAVMFQLLAANTSATESVITMIVGRRRQFGSWCREALERATEQNLMVVGDTAVAAELLLDALGLLAASKRRFFGDLAPALSPFDTAREAMKAFCTSKGLATLTTMGPIIPVLPKSSLV
jgi:AcrR family transcriptional regulator